MPLLVYAISGVLIKKIVLIQFQLHHLVNLVSCQQWLEHEYLLQLHPISNAERGEVLNLKTLRKYYEEEHVMLSNITHYIYG